MAENVSFRIVDIRKFQGGVEKAQEQMHQIYGEADHRAGEELWKADELYKHVEYVLDLMDEDRRTAEEVLEHNKNVIYTMEQDLSRLEREAAELAAAYSKAYDNYENAKEAETRARNTELNSTGNSQLDSKMAALREQSIKTAHSAVRQSESNLSAVKAQQSANAKSVEDLRKAIEKVKQINERLYHFIRQIKVSIEQVAVYRKQLQDDTHALRWELPQFTSASHTCTMNMVQYQELANRAIACGLQLCDQLDPEHEVGHDDCLIYFTDLHALGRISKGLQCVCEGCETAQDTMTENARFHAMVMQDATIAETSAVLTQLCGNCWDRIRELRDTAGRCAKADACLQEYYRLKYDV